MIESISLFGSRRAYEFLPDDLRLTVLSAIQVYEAIRTAFAFQAMGIGTPPPTFGEVPQTVPPGLVFQTGMMTTGEGAIVPIRALHIEPRRIVIEVVAPTLAIDPVFARLCEVVNQIQVVDGIRAIGTPQSTRDYSTLSAHIPAAPGATLSPRLVDVLRRSLPESEGPDDLTLVPTIYVQWRRRNEPFGGPIGPEGGATELALRVGTTPDQHIYFSGAFLDSEHHEQYLSELAAALSA